RGRRVQVSSSARAGRHQLARGAGDPLRGHPPQGLGRQPDLGRRAGAVVADVGVADVLAAGALGPGLPQSTPAGHADDPGPAPVTRRARAPQLESLLRHRLSAKTMRWSHTKALAHEAPSTKGPRPSGRAPGSAAEGTRSAYDNRRPGPNTLSEDAEAFLRNYPEGQWTGRERERLTNAIDRVAGNEPERKRETMTIQQSAWTGMVPVDDAALYVSDTGGRGRPVVYLNGAYADQSHWRRVIADLGSDYRHITYDERARGKSKRSADYSFEACIRDLDAVLTARGVDRPLLVGWSSGGILGWHWADRNPDRVLGVVTVDA